MVDLDPQFRVSEPVAKGRTVSRRNVVRLGIGVAGLAILGSSEATPALAGPAVIVARNVGGGNGEVPQTVHDVVLPTEGEVQKYGVAANWAECFPWVREKSGGIVDLDFMRREREGRFVNGSEYLPEGAIRVYHSGDLEINGEHKRAGENELVLGFAQGQAGYYVRSEGGWSGYAETDGRDLNYESMQALQARRFKEVIANKVDVRRIYVMEFNGTDGNVGVITKPMNRDAMDNFINAAADICPNM